MRCLALADALPGKTVFFLDEPILWQKELNAGGYPQQTEAFPDGASATLSAFDDGEIGAFFFDGYAFSQSLISEATQRGFCTEIRDIPGKTSAHVTLAPFASADIKSSKTLSGPSYALLGERFFIGREAVIRKSVAARATHILVAFGAFDSANITSQVLDSLRPIILDQVITVVLGRYAPHLDDIRRTVDAMHNARLIVDEENMASLLHDCDMAIGAGGVSMLERMCMGVPSIIITTAKNQAEQIHFAEQADAVVHMGQIGSFTPQTLRDTFLSLVGDVGRRTGMKKNGMDLIDGRGAIRSADALSSLREDFERMKQC